MRLLGKRGYEIAGDYSEAINEPLYSDAVEIGKQVLEDFAEGKIGEIYLAYTVFKNTVSHIPTLMKVMPVEVKEQEEEAKEETPIPMNYEPEEEEVLSMICLLYTSDAADDKPDLWCFS